MRHTILSNLHAEVEGREHCHRNDMGWNMETGTAPAPGRRRVGGCVVSCLPC